MSDVADQFRRSPFEPLRQHMAKVQECVAHVRPMFDLVRQGAFDDLHRLAKTIFKAEHAADLIKDEIRQTIPKTFYLPVYRGDLLAYLALQDDMADAVEDLAVLLTIKRLAMPPQLADQISVYVDKILKTCDQATQVCAELGELAGDGFTQEGVDKVMTLVGATERAEWEADREQYALSQALFALEDELKYTDLILWFRVFGRLGELANHAEKVADRARRMLAK